MQPSIPPRPVSVSAPASKPTSPLIPKKSFTPAPPSQPLAARSKQTPATLMPKISQPKIEEIKYQSKLVNPIEEIRSMKIIDFRRLGSTPAAAAKKIEEKINLLEAESFAKKYEAIKAWKESEINRLYLELGGQGMEEKKSIAEVVAERERAGRPTLTEAEVEAIIELNRKFRY